MSDSHDNDRVLTAQAISNHERSLFLGHLLDVASTDQDRLKAWFTGKLDFAPPVVNLTKGGCKLAGVRLDILANRRAAAIVSTKTALSTYSPGPQQITRSILILSPF
jgi:anti-sigma factor RsiW